MQKDGQNTIELCMLIFGIHIYIYMLKIYTYRLVYTPIIHFQLRFYICVYVLYVYVSIGTTIVYIVYQLR